MSNFAPSPYNFGIYAITLKGTKRRYIGSSINIQARWSRHVSLLQRNRHHTPHLQRAWNKYGEDAFVFSMVEICSLELLNEREEAYLSRLTNLYNTTLSAYAPMRGRKHSPKAITKMRIAKRNRSPETLAKVSRSLKDFWASDKGVTRRASISVLGLSVIAPALSPYDRQRLSLALEGNLPDYFANDQAA